MSKRTKVVSYLLVVTLIICNCSVVGAGTKNLKLGDKAKGKLTVNSSADYVINVERKMKVKVTITSELTNSAVNSTVEEDDRDFEVFMLDYEEYDDYLDSQADEEDEEDEEDDDDTFYDLFGDDDDDEDDEDEFDFIIRDFADIGEDYSETVELDKGKYVLVILSDKCEINYTVAVSDVSQYTTKIKLNKSKISLKVHKSYQLKASPKQRSKINKKGTRKVSNKKIAKVDKNGKVKAVKAGKCTISAWVKGGKKVKCAVTVKGKKKK